MRHLAVAAAISLVALLALGPAPALAGGKSLQPPTNQPSTPTAPSSPPGMGGGRSAGTDTPSSSPSRPAEQRAAPAPVVHWNSAASAIWRVHGRVHVAIGYSGARSDADGARASAIEA